MPKVNVGSLELFYQQAGSGAPVLFISGMGSDHTMWGYQVRAFKGSYRCVCFDNRDVGRSSQAAAPYSVRDIAADVVGLLDALGIEKAHVVGWSMGGAIAQELVINHSQRVRSLCLIATYTSGDPRGSANLNAWKLLRQRLSPREYQEAIYPWVFTWRDYLKPGLVESFIQKAVDNPYPQSQAAYERQVDAVLGHNAEDRLHLIPSPTLVLAGEEDILAPLRFSRILAERIPSARLEVIREAGHALIWTHAEAVNQALRGFLEDP